LLPHLTPFKSRWTAPLNKRQNRYFATVKKKSNDYFVKALILVLKTNDYFVRSLVLLKKKQLLRYFFSDKSNRYSLLVTNDPDAQ
jgi:hypothetical protein